MPPLWVRKLYEDATPSVGRLTIDPIDMDALEDVERINNEIEVKSKGDKEALKWVIEIAEINKQINYAWKSALNYDLEGFRAAKAVLNHLNFLNHYPWTYDCPKAPWISKRYLKEYPPTSVKHRNIQKSLEILETENDRDGLEPDTDNEIESLGVNTPGESLEDGTQVNRLKRELDYLAGFEDSGNTMKRPRRANNQGSTVNKFGISRKRPRADSEDENTKQGFARANKSQRSEDGLVDQFSRLRISSNTKVQTEKKLAELISSIRACLKNAEAMANNL